MSPSLVFLLCWFSVCMLDQSSALGLIIMIGDIEFEKRH